MKIFLAIVLLLVVLFGMGACTGYNKAIKKKEMVPLAWAQVENQLQRRYDLIPNLVNSVKGVSKQEQEVFLELANARKGYFNAQSTSEKAGAASAVEGSLAKFMSMTEKYPDLRSSEAFLKLMDQLEGTENRLSVERKRFNERVADNNIYRKGFPSKIWAEWAGMEEATHFKPPQTVTESGSPKVEF